MVDLHHTGVPVLCGVLLLVVLPSCLQQPGNRQNRTQNTKQQSKPKNKNENSSGIAVGLAAV